MKLLRAVVVMALLLAGCGGESPPEASNDLLYLRTAAGIAVATAGADSAAFQALDSLPSSDWSTLVRAQGRGNTTRVQGVDPRSGKLVWSKDLQGRYTLKIVSADGKMAALSSARESYYSAGRTETMLTIVTADGSSRVLELKGNYEPEAFSTDKENLFVVEYLPARRPTHYRVRNLDLVTGQVGGVYTVDAELQEAMRGTARVQTMSADGTRLYTLYTLKEHGERHTFIHVLSLDEEWAHCIDLPDGFQFATQSATSMTVTDDGKRLFVGNAESGVIADIDTEGLKVLRTGQVSYGLGTPTHMTTSDGRLHLSSGRMITVVSLRTFKEIRSIFMGQPITGLQPASDGYRLYVGQRDRIAVVDAVTGDRLGSFDPPGLDRIRLLGRSTQQPSQPRSGDTIECAC